MQINQTINHKLKIEFLFIFFQIRWRPIVSGLLLQFLIAIAMMKYDFFFDGAEFITNKFWAFREHAFYGAGQVFGDPFFLFHPYLMIVSRHDVVINYLLLFIRVVVITASIRLLEHK